MAEYPANLYQGWDPVAAAADYKATGGAGKAVSTGGGSTGGGYVGGIDESQVPSTLDYINKLNVGEDAAFKELLMAMRARKSPLDVYSELETASGLPQLRGAATSLAKEISGLEDTLETVEPDVAARSRESLMTEAQRRGVVAQRREPYEERLTKTATGLGRLKELIGITEGGIGTKAELFMRGQEQEIEPMKLQYTALVDRNARNISGFTDDKQTKLTILMDKLQRERQLSDMEWQEANRLKSEESQYLKTLQTSAASAGYKVTGSESSDQLLSQIGTKAAEQIAFERRQATKGTATEKKENEALMAIRREATSGVSYEDVVRRYSGEVDTYKIRQTYEDARKMSVGATAAQEQQWQLSPETVYKTEASAKESENDWLTNYLLQRDALRR